MQPPKDMTCEKKSTKKSPAYGRGFKPKFSVTKVDQLKSIINNNLINIQARDHFLYMNYLDLIKVILKPQSNLFFEHLFLNLNHL